MRWLEALRATASESGGGWEAHGGGHLYFSFRRVGVHLLCDGERWSWPGSPCQLTVLGLVLELVLGGQVLCGWLMGESWRSLGFLLEEWEVLGQDVGWWRRRWWCLL